VRTTYLRAPAPDSDAEAWVKVALKGAIILSDIGHAAKTFPLHARWSRLVRQEFFQQGDEERRLGLPISPLCDRNNAEPLAQSQLGACCCCGVVCCVRCARAFACPCVCVCV